MKKEKTKFFTLILTALLLTSCGGAAQTPDVTGTTDGGSDTVSSAPDETESSLPERDYGGYEFRMFIRGDDAFIPDMWAEDLDGETMNDAIFERNRRVSETYGVNFKMFSVSGDDEGKEAMNTIMAGDDSYDILVCHARRLSQYSHNDLLLEWNENLPYIDLDGEWWNQDARDNLSIAGKLYTCAGDISYMNLGAADCMFYNKRILADIGAADIYDTVRDGNWTLDVFSELVKKGASDLNGDGKWGDEDRYGLSGYSNHIDNTLMCGFGSILSIGKDKDDIPYFDLDNETSIAKMTKLAGIVGGDDGFAYKGKDWGGSFTNGNALFMCDSVFAAVSMRDSEVEFGIIPTPKWDEEQENYINNGGSPFFMTVPITSEDLDRTGAIMEALAYDSMGLIDKAMYDIVLKGKSARDEESADMLDIIFSTLQYYHPLANSYLNAPLADQYIWVGKTDFASYFASVKDKIQSDIDTAMKTYRENVK